MAKQYVLSERMVRSLRRNDQSQRSTPVYPLATRGYVQPPNMHTMRMESAFANVVQATIPRALAGLPGGPPNYIRLGVGKAELLVPQDGEFGQHADFKGSGIIVKVFNPTAFDQPVNQGVHLLRDWRTGRWLIIVGNLAAEFIYFKADAAFAFSNSVFPATMVNYFGDDPTGLRWNGYVYNPAVDSGSYFFQGAEGVYGMAQWHDVDTTTPTTPAGYHCYQLQCAAA